MRLFSGLLMFIFLGMCALNTSCAWVGRTAGKAQAKLERKANDLEQGYERGYEAEKGKQDQSGGKSEKR